MSGLSISEETNPTLCIQYGFEGTHPWKLKSQHFNSTVIVSSPIHCAGVQSQHNTERTSLPSSPASLTSSLPCFCLSFLFHYAFRQLSSPSTSSPPPLLSYPSLSLSSCRGAVTCLRKPNRTLRSYLTASCYACVCVCECLCVCMRVCVVSRNSFIPLWKTSQQCFPVWVEPWSVSSERRSETDKNSSSTGSGSGVTPRRDTSPC